MTWFRWWYIYIYIYIYIFVTLSKNLLVPRLYTLYYIHPMTICILPVSTDNWSAFPEYFCQPSKFLTGEMVPLAMRTLNWQWELDILSKWMTVDVCLVAVVECWPIMDTIATLNSIIHVIRLLFSHCCHHPPHLSLSYRPHCYAAQHYAFLKNCQKGPSQLSS